MKSPIDFLIKNTPKSRRDKARLVRIRNIVKKKDRLRNTNYLIINVSTHATARPHRYEVKIEYDGVKVLKSRTIIISCTCPDWKFTWEYAVTKAGHSKIQFSNGKPPRERNPRQIPGVCGHVFRAILLVKRRGL